MFTLLNKYLILKSTYIYTFTPRMSVVASYGVISVFNLVTVMEITF